MKISIGAAGAAIRMFFRTIVAVVAIAVGLWMVTGFVLRIYDGQTKREVVNLVESELNLESDRNAMATFMQKHTARYGVDDDREFAYIGFMGQDEIDKIIFRQVSIELKFDPVTNKYLSCRVVFYYTFL
ncbi:MAG: hypothetical protein R3C52_02585 [Hyphomonadaceae bacterium]